MEEGDIRLRLLRENGALVFESPGGDNYDCFLILIQSRIHGNDINFENFWSITKSFSPHKHEMFSPQ